MLFASLLGSHHRLGPAGAASHGATSDRATSDTATSDTATPDCATSDGAASDGGAPVDAAARRLHRAAEAALRTCRETSYQHHTVVDAARGAYHLDCSGLLDHLLAGVDPAALAVIPTHRQAGRALASDYERHFAGLGPGGDGHWSPVPTVDGLRAGDVLAWLVASGSASRDTGHVVVVDSRPRTDPGRPDVRLVEVIDSTGHGHGHDTRPVGQGGLGRGTIGLGVDGDGRPVSVYWRGDRSTVATPHRIAAARLAG